MAASLWSSSVDGAVETLDVSEIVANLGSCLQICQLLNGRLIISSATSFFLFGLAIGPMVFSPLSEIPSIGKNKIYIPTLLLYVVMQLPIVLSNNIAVILVFRFITGILASPCQAQGGGSVSDLWRSQKLGYPMIIYDNCKLRH